MLARPRGRLVTEGATRFDAGYIAAVFVSLAGCALLGWEARHSTFTGDEWSFILQRRGFSADVFLTPHNEHLSAIPVLAYKVFLAVFGLSA